MTYNKAIEELKRVGCKNATGDALAAMYAQLLETIHGGKPQRYYAYLCKCDEDVAVMAKILLEDRAKAWMALIC